MTHAVEKIGDRRDDDLAARLFEHYNLVAAPVVDGERKLIGRLTIVVTNRPNALGTLTTIIGKANANIMSIKITNRTVDFFDILVDIEVKDTDHLMNIIAALRANTFDLPLQVNNFRD